ncbi:MAG: homocysteine S-methyltransferase family protein [Ignavibacteriales bacterium]|nr:homocysteine S-methyltransferase family protein [Ignavibacteriales bacterium]
MNRSRIDLIAEYESLKRPLLLDGAMGSLLQQKNIPLHKYLWSSIANITHPDAVVQIHKDYIDAGAEIITTNTFRSNPNAFNQSNLHITNEEFIRCGVQLAFDAIEEKQILVAGSNAPAEDCYQIERSITQNKLDYNHKLHIEQLWESGCDLIWNETQSHWDEIKIICDFCSENSYPFTVNLYFNDELKLLSGEPLNEAVEFISEFSPTCIGFNCVTPQLLNKYFEKNIPPKKWGFYFNCGGSEHSDAIIKCVLDPLSYSIEIKQLLELNPMYAGSCCGSNPDHTRAIKVMFDELYRN